MISYAKIRPLAYIVNIYFLSLSLAVDLHNYTVPLSNGKWLALKCCISIAESSLISGIESLRSPNSNLTLKLITYALGIQISTCSINSTLPPVPSGANATLIDATSYLNTPLFNKIPQLLLSNPPTSMQELEIGKQSFGASLTSVFHFNDSRTFQGKVFSTISAPIDALQWVALTTTVVNATLKEAYCVQTAGGLVPLQCDGNLYDKIIASPYAAQYWFYG